MSVTNQLMDHSVITEYLMNNMSYLVMFGFLSYNLPLLFKLKSETGYIVRAGIMSIASLSIIPATMILPDAYPIAFKLVMWGLCFLSGVAFASFGARNLQAKFSLLFSRFTVKNSVRRGAKTDIRYMGKELPIIANYNPLKFINLRKGFFIGLDEKVKPIYLKSMDDWYKRHFLIVGATRSGKGVAMQYMGIQSLMLGETVVFLDPKGDKYMPHIFKAKCDELNVPYNYIALTCDVPQINLIADFNNRDLKNCLVEAFSQREIGSESDVYRKNEQEFLENFANFICQANTEYVDGDYHDNHHHTTDEIKYIHKSLVEICRDYDLSRYADKYKSSVSDLNKLCNIKSINASNGKSLSELITGGGCVYIVGDLLDETMKKIQRFIFCRVIQLARNHANEADRNGNKEQNITVFADELVAHISRFVAESYTVSLGWGLKIVSAIQDLKLLKGAPTDLDPDFLIGAIFGNSQNKLFYRADDITTADFLSDMTGKIQIEEEQKLVTRNSLNSEKLDKQTRLIQSERNYFDRNMILNLKQFEAVFCASLGYRNTIASLCKTSPVIIKQDGNNVVNGKKLIEVIDIQNNYEYENQDINTQDSVSKKDDSNEVSTISNNEQLFLNNWHDELDKHNALINELTQTTTNTEIQEFTHAKNDTNTNGENNANNQPRNNNRNSQTKENSTSKPDYLF